MYLLFVQLWRDQHHPVLCANKRESLMSDALQYASRHAEADRLTQNVACTHTHTTHTHIYIFRVHMQHMYIHSSLRAQVMLDQVSDLTSPHLHSAAYSSGPVVATHTERRERERERDTHTHGCQGKHNIHIAKRRA